MLSAQTSGGSARQTRPVSSYVSSGKEEGEGDKDGKRAARAGGLKAQYVRKRRDRGVVVQATHLASAGHPQAGYLRESIGTGIPVLMSSAA